MKRILAIGVAPAVLGVVAAFFRAKELAFSFDFATGLPNGALVITPILLVLAAVLLVLCLVFPRRIVREPAPERAHPGLAAVALFGCAVLLALGALELYENQLARDMILYIHCALTFVTAAALAVLGLRGLRWSANSAYSVCGILPVLWACFSLILIFRERIADPIIADYVFLLFAFVCILLFTYAQAGYVYRRNRLRVALCVTVLGVYFCVIELFAPLIAAQLSSAYPKNYDFTLLLPLALFAVYMPAATSCMLSNENGV